jgi:hypothetical protein
VCVDFLDFDRMRVCISRSHRAAAAAATALVHALPRARRTFSERKLESESFLSLSAATWCCHYHREQLTSVYEEHFGWHALKKICV